MQSVSSDCPPPRDQPPAGEHKAVEAGMDPSTQKPGAHRDDTSVGEAPPPYTQFPGFRDAPVNIPHAGRDLRRNSNDSIGPSHSQVRQQNERRILLLIFIHGFQGNERSFKSFPAHLHNVVTNLLTESHIVYTKIYPRYRSKRNITVARDDFSRWLLPHESERTDVILFGHSMGGLMSADVVLKPRQDGTAFQHRILGTINFDVPFLGMHPGVIKTGLESLFVPAPATPAEPEETPQGYFASPNQSTSSINASPGVQPPSNSMSSPDPNFNPAYENDVHLPVRKGWRSALHFVNKHSDHLIKSTKQLVTAHTEYMGAMLDYGALNARYARIRSLSEIQDNLRRSVSGGKFTPPRIRFVNYYTASTGRPKREKSPKTAQGTEAARSDSQLQSHDQASSNRSIDERSTDRPRPEDSLAPSRTPPAPSSPRLHVEEVTNDGVIEKKVEDLNIGEPAASNEGPKSRQKSPSRPESPSVVPSFDPPPTSDNTRPTFPQSSSASIQSSSASITPSAHASTTDTASLRTMTSNDPSLSRLTTTDSLSTTTSAQTESTRGRSDGARPSKAQKDRKFCMLPPKDSLGNRDPAWIRVHMKGVDEVSAHCGLFFETCPAYPGLVTDVAERVHAWVQDAEGERVAKELSEREWD